MRRRKKLVGALRDLLSYRVTLAELARGDRAAGPAAARDRHLRERERLPTPASSCARAGRALWVPREALPALDLEPRLLAQAYRRIHRLRRPLRGGCGRCHRRLPSSNAATVSTQDGATALPSAAMRSRTRLAGAAPPVR